LAPNNESDNSESNSASAMMVPNALIGILLLSVFDFQVLIGIN
jgi:hypothetical protein